MLRSLLSRDSVGRRRWMTMGWTLGMASLLIFPATAWAGSLQCPARQEVLCIPGAIADRVVCAMENEILEFENPTAFCLACHDLVTRRDKTVRLDEVRSMCWIHPLEILYPTEKKNFMPTGDLYSAIRLVEGRISCASCHSGRDADNYYLSVHALQPNLCAQCHYR